MSKRIIKTTFMTIIFILALFTYSFSESESNPINLIDEFQYKLGDCGVDENGVPLWVANEKSDWADFKSIQELSGEIDTQDTVWFRIKIPSLEYRNPGIYFEHFYANSFEIYLDSEKIFDKKREWFYNHNSFILPLQNTYTDKYMYAKVLLVYKKAGPKDNVLIGDYKTLQNMFLTKDLFNIYFSLGLIFISTIIFTLAVFMKNQSKKHTISLAFIILFIGIILIIADSNFLMYFPNLEQFFLTLYDVSLFSLLPLLIYFFESAIITDLKFKSFVHRLWQFQAFYSLFCTVLVLINIATGYKLNTLGSFFTINIIGLLFIIDLITLICTGIYYSIKGNIYAKIFIFGFSIFAISLLSELAIFLFINKSYDFFVWIWGLLAFIISLIAILIRQYLKNQEKLSEYLKEIRKINKIANTDYLTKLPNRMDMTNKIQSSIDNYNLNSEGFVLALCDIDNFKKINDTYGHTFGDEVLIHVAQILKHSVGQAHFVARWGGEEFLLLLTTPDYQEAYDILEHVRLSINHHEFQIKNETIHITATFGMCKFDNSKNIEKCLKYIDEALYTGKKNGKDRIIIYEELNKIAISNNTIKAN